MSVKFDTATFIASHYALLEREVIWIFYISWLQIFTSDLQIIL